MLNAGYWMLDIGYWILDRNSSKFRIADIDSVLGMVMFKTKIDFWHGFHGLHG